MGKDDLKQLIAQARLNEAVDQLLEQVKAYSPASKSDKSVGKLSDILIINSGKLHGLLHDKMLGILDRQTEQVTLAQVQQAILYVIDELSDEFWNVPPQRPTTKQNSGNEQTELLEAVESLKQVQTSEFEFDLFVSFSSLDREVLQPVVEKLRGYGLRVFISDQNLKNYVGISFSETIQIALENSQHFILVCSPNSGQSYWVKIEWETFFNQFHIGDRNNRRIFVLKGNDFNLKFVPLFLRNMQIADNAEQIVNTLVAETKSQQRLKIKNEESKQQRLAAQKAEEERIENEKQAKLLAEQLLKEKQQKAEQERLEQQKLQDEMERAGKQIFAAQKAEEERIEKEKHPKFLAIKLLKEKQEQDRIEQQKLAEEKAEKQRLAAQKAEEERIENDKAKLLIDKLLKEKRQKTEQDRLGQQKLEEELAERQRLASPKAEEEQSNTGLKQQPSSAETHRSLQDPAASLRTINPNRKKLIYLLSPLVLIALLVSIVYFTTKTPNRIQPPVQKEQEKVSALDNSAKNIEPKNSEITVNQEVKRDSIAKLAKKEEDFYKKAIYQNTIEAFNGYMKAYPGGKFTAQAKKKIIELQTEVPQKQIDIDKAENERIFDPKDKLIQAVNAPMDEAANPQMVLVNGGEFMMGDDKSEYANEKPAHKEIVSDFYIGKYEVTQKEWTDIMGSNPLSFKGCDNCPVEQVSWNDVQEFLKKLNQKTGKTYRLPTEAEWEYACRAGTTTPFNTGNNLTTSQANYDGNYPYNNNPKGIYREKTMPVGSFAPNALGLYDMHGNVWEWCNDWYDGKYYANSPQKNPKGPSTGSGRVVRGGSWGSDAQRCRTAARSYGSPVFRDSNLGFRLVFVP